jgi:drug/metabolite transporter (DMT)-like permease
MDNLRIPPKFALIISILAVSTASIMIRLSAAPPLAIATYRMILSTLILIPLFVLGGGHRTFMDLGWREKGSLVIVGIILAFHFASWITSLTFTSVASSVVFVHVDPIFVAIVSHFWFNERITRRTLLGIILGFLGATLIAVGDAGLGEMNLYGDALALIGAIMLGIYILSGRRIRQRLDLVNYVTPVYATSAIVLFLGSVITGTKLTGYGFEDKGIFLMIAIVPMIFGHTVYNWALKYISAPIVSISLLGEPFGATILAYLLLGESPGITTIIGGVITMMGILLTIWEGSIFRKSDNRDQN